ARRTEYRKRLVFLEVAAIFEAVQRRAVGDGNPCRGLIAHAVRNGNDVACFGNDLLAAAVAANKRRYSLTDIQAGDIFTQRLDGARDLGPRRVWKPRRDLILVAQGKRVEEVEADRSHLDEDLVRSWVRLRRLFDAERFNPPELPDLRHAHRRLLPRRQRWRDA